MVKSPRPPLEKGENYITNICVFKFQTSGAAGPSTLCELRRGMLRSIRIDQKRNFIAPDKRR